MVFFTISEAQLSSPSIWSVIFNAFSNLESKAPKLVNQLMKKATDALTNKCNRLEKTDQGISSDYLP